MSVLPPFRIEPLDTARHRREEFDCGVAALNDYLKQQARKEMEARVALCFVAVPESDLGCIAGFYTLSSASVRRAELSDSKLLKKLPSYRDFPATLLGRLARSTYFKGQGMGGHLMISALERAVAGSSKVASWAIITDPKDIKATRFYAGFGFHSLSGNRMFLPMKQAIEWLKPNAP